MAAAPSEKSDPAEHDWLKFFLRILLPVGGCVALFTKSSDNVVSYFDESMSEGKLPITCVAGYIFEPSAYLEFDAGMKAILRKYKLCYFRAAECFHLTDQFKKYDRNSPDPELIERDVIRLIRKHAVYGVAAAVSEALYLLLQPRVHEQIMGGCYSMLCQWCLGAVGRWAKENKLRGEVAYFFEAGCPSQSEANRDLNRISGVPALKRMYRYGSHSFVPKAKMRGLQAADLLAYFCRREADELGRILADQPPLRNRRKDFQALIGTSKKELSELKHIFQYFDDESLKELFSHPENSDPSMRWY
jgi:hypothetical protein